MIVLGLGGIATPDAACAVLRDGQLAAAVEERKLTRNALLTLPYAAIRESLRLAKASASEVGLIALARPFPGGEELHQELRRLFPKSEIAVVEHHAAHAASSFFASPFDEATVLTLDRHGDFQCSGRWRASGTELRLERETYLPDSVGEVYSRVTALLGYREDQDEHRVQWLSVKGDDRFFGLFQAILGLDGDTWPRIDNSYFDTSAGGHFSSKFFDAIGVPSRDAIPDALKPHLAAGVQLALEQALLVMSANSNNLCIAGGLAFNVLAIARLEQAGPVFVQPAAGNSGTALGAAYYAWHCLQGNPKGLPLTTMAWGPEYSPDEIKKVLENCKLSFKNILTNDELISTVVGMLGEHRIIAWMQGRMEFGPRALGWRSILASPLDPYSTENLNVFIKHREGFRKFAASVPKEYAAQYFEPGSNANFLATASRVLPQHRKTFEGALLGEDLIRLHVVDEQENPLYHRLLVEAGKATGLPVLYNTSFNLFGDPLVCSPRDAVRSFYSSGIDALVVGSFLLTK